MRRRCYTNPLAFVVIVKLTLYGMIAMNKLGSASFRGDCLVGALSYQSESSKVIVKLVLYGMS